MQAQRDELALVLHVVDLDEAVGGAHGKRVHLVATGRQLVVVVVVVVGRGSRDVQLAVDNFAECVVRGLDCKAKGEQAVSRRRHLAAAHPLLLSQRLRVHAPHVQTAVVANCRQVHACVVAGQLEVDHHRVVAYLAHELGAEWRRVVVCTRRRCRPQLDGRVPRASHHESSLSMILAAFEQARHEADARRRVVVQVGERLHASAVVHVVDAHEAVQRGHEQHGRRRRR